MEKQIEWAQVSHRKPQTPGRWHHILKVLKEMDCPSGVQYTVKTSRRNDGEIQTSAEEGRRQALQTCFRRIAEGSPPDRREMAPEGDLEPPEWRASSQNSNYLGTYSSPSFLLWTSLKHIWKFKAKIKALPFGVFKACRCTKRTKLRVISER